MLVEPVDLVVIVAGTPERRIGHDVAVDVHGHFDL
jgi:hypothetical protein